LKVNILGFLQQDDSVPLGPRELWCKYLVTREGAKGKEVEALARICHHVTFFLNTALKEVIVRKAHLCLKKKKRMCLDETKCVSVLCTPVFQQHLSKCLKFHFIII